MKPIRELIGEPIVVSLLLVRYVNLEKYKQSPFGSYVRVYMTRLMEGVRLFGYLVMGLGVWYHLAWLIPVGLVIILLGWVRGLLWPRSPSAVSQE